MVSTSVPVTLLATERSSILVAASKTGESDKNERFDVLTELGTVICSCGGPANSLLLFWLLIFQVRLGGYQTEEANVHSVFLIMLVYPGIVHIF